MDVKLFFRRWLRLAMMAAVGIGTSGLASAEVIYTNGADITSTYSREIGAAGGTLTFQNSASNINLSGNVTSDLKVTNTSNTAGGRVVFGGTQTDTITQSNVTFTGTGVEFGSKLNYTTYPQEGPETTFYEVGVLFGSNNDEDGVVDVTPAGNARVTFANGSETRFWGDVIVGSTDNANADGNSTSGSATVIFETGSQTTFENQNTYFGGGGYKAYDSSEAGYSASNKGGDATLVFNGGTTTFNQRAVIGGGSTSFVGDDGKVIKSPTGHSTVIFAGGTNSFYYKNALVEGNDKNYYGVYFSATSGKAGITESGGTDIFITGGVNNFEAETHVGGNYGLIAYGDIVRSKDDFDVVYGGTNNFTITGGKNLFSARSTFGAANSQTTVTFQGGISRFTGAERSINMGKGDIDTGYSASNYNGQDLPFVFFGGKDLTVSGTSNNDLSYLNEYFATFGHEAFAISEVQIADRIAANAVVTINGGDVRINTTAFVGGANYNELSGSSDLDTLTKNFAYTGGAVGNVHAFTNDTERFEALGDDQYVYHYTDEAGNACTYNMIIDDGGIGSMSMTSGALTLGIYNTTQLYEHSDQGEVNPIYTINRNAQVQIIGTHSAFNATGGSIYFTVDRNGTTCLNQDGVAVERLNAARMVFDSMTITDNVQLYLKPQTSWADLIQGTGAEYFTIENFVDSTGDQLKIGHEENGQYVYQKDRLFYSIGVEKVVDTGALADKNFKDQARLHIYVKDPHEVVPDGNLGDNMDDYLDDLDDDNEPDDIREPLDDIWNSDSKEEAQKKFDDLAGGIFGDWFNAQTQRITSLNNMLANRTIADDSGLDQFCQQCCCPNGQECNPYYPGPACNGCERCAARRQCGLGFQIGRMPRFCQPKRTAWASFIGDYGDSNYWKGFTKYHQESTGLAVGMEWRTVDCDKIGVYFNYSDSAITHGNSKGNSGSRVDSDDYNFGLYAKWDAIAFGGYGFANAAFTYNDINSERFYNTQNYNSQLYGKTNGLSTSVYLERGWLFAEDHGFVINPFLSIQYAYLQMDDFTESGSAANMRLHAYDMSYSSLRGQIGARISRDFIVGCQNWQILRLTLSGAWLHEFLDPQAEYYTELLGDTQHKQWFMKSNGAGRDYANLMFSLDYRFTKRLSANASYNAFFNQFQTINAASASLRFDF